MRQSVIALLSVAAAFYSGSAVAQQANQPLAQNVSVVTTADDPVICKASYHEGMVIDNRVCKTQHEWKRDQTEQQQELMLFQTRSTYRGH